MADKLTPRQIAQIAVLETLPPRFELVRRLVEEVAALKADDVMLRRLCRILDEGRAQANGIGLTALAETLGTMSMMARRGGGHQMKVRGLREGLGSLKINFEGAWRSATTPEVPGVEGSGGASSSEPGGGP